MKIIKSWFNKAGNSNFYNIEDISKWDLDMLHLLLKIEKSRIECMNHDSEQVDSLLKEFDYYLPDKNGNDD